MTLSSARGPTCQAQLGLVSHRLAGHSTLLTTSSHIPKTNTKFPHSWIQLKIHLQIQIQSPCLACFTFVNHAYSKHKYIYKFNQRVWSCDGSASIRMCCESNQNLIFLKWNWSVELSCSTSRVGERTGIYPLKILPPSCLLEERFKSNQFKQFWQYWLWDMFLVQKKWCFGGGAMSLDNIL